MGEFWDRLAASGRGVGQGATFGWGDELGAKILANWIPKPDDPEGIGREYAGGSAENQYKNMYRADDSEAQQRHPWSYAAGNLLGAAPAAVATGGGVLGSGLSAAGKLAAMGLTSGLEGAIQGAGVSENTGSELAKDAAKGGALSAGTGLVVGELGAPLVRAAARRAAPAVRNMARQGKQFFHHSPIQNAPSIAKKGLKIDKATTTTGWGHNKGKMFFFDDRNPEVVRAYNEKARAWKDAPAAPVYRTSAVPSQQPGAAKGVLIRTEDTPINQLQVFDPARQDWGHPSVIDTAKLYAPEQYVPPLDKLGLGPVGRRAKLANTIEGIGAGEASFTEKAAQAALEKLKSY